MKCLTVFLIAVILVSCDTEDKVIDTTIPACIQTILDDPDLSRDLKTIQVQENNDELHYWLNTDERHADGPEAIVNAKCDTICGFCGECLPAECLKEYDANWMIIWEK